MSFKDQQCNRLLRSQSQTVSVTNLLRLRGTSTQNFNFISFREVNKQWWVSHLVTWVVSRLLVTSIGLVSNVTSNLEVITTSMPLLVSIDKSNRWRHDESQQLTPRTGTADSLSHWSLLADQLICRLSPKSRGLVLYRLQLLRMLVQNILILF